MPDTYPIRSIFLPISLKNGCMNLKNSRASPLSLIHRSGVNTTGKAGSILRGHGFAHVHDLGGGIDAWRQANLPIVKK